MKRAGTSAISSKLRFLTKNQTTQNQRSPLRRSKTGVFNPLKASNSKRFSLKIKPGAAQSKFQQSKRSAKQRLYG